MNRLHILFLSSSIVLALTGCGSSSTKSTSSEGTGAKLSAGFSSNCAGCHGSSGQGGSSRKLTNSSLSLEAWQNVVRNGRSGTGMGSYSASRYSQTDLQADYKAITGK